MQLHTHHTHLPTGTRLTSLLTHTRKHPHHTHLPNWHALEYYASLHVDCARTRSVATHSDSMGLAGGFQTDVFFAPLARPWPTLPGGALSRALVASDTGLLPASSAAGELDVQVHVLLGHLGRVELVRLGRVDGEREAARGGLDVVGEAVAPLGHGRLERGLGRLEEQRGLGRGPLLVDGLAVDLDVYCVAQLARVDGVLLDGHVEDGDAVLRHDELVEPLVLGVGAVEGLATQAHRRALGRPPQQQRGYPARGEPKVRARAVALEHRVTVHRDDGRRRRRGRRRGRGRRRVELEDGEVRVDALRALVVLEHHVQLPRDGLVHGPGGGGVLDVVERDAPRLRGHVEGARELVLVGRRVADDVPARLRLGALDGAAAREGHLRPARVLPRQDGQHAAAVVVGRAGDGELGTDALQAGRRRRRVALHAAARPLRLGARGRGDVAP
eukprot:scaffold125339_cov66-Phaeocystis_antarctica.AAC.3